MRKIIIILILVFRSSEQTEPGLYVGLLTGGYSGPVTASVEVLGGECRVGDLPQPTVGHLTLVTEDSKVLVCGGRDGSKNYIQTCREYDAKSKEWKHHSHLNERRYRASGASLQSKTMILGGGGGRDTEVLSSGSNEWRTGPALPGGATWGACAVAISGSSLLLIGGRSRREVAYLNQVAEFSSITSSWIQWNTLSVARLGHACHKLGSTVVVAGGITFGGVFLKSTEVIDLVTHKVSKAFDMATPRHGFGMTELGRGANTLLLAFGTAGNPTGGDFDWSLSRSAEEWDPVAGNWTFSPTVMKTRSFFGAATVDANLVCIKGRYSLCLCFIHNIVCRRGSRIS